MVAYNPWVLILASSLASSLGSCVIWADVVWNYFVPSRKFSILNDRSFLIVTLSLSCGTLLTTALYSLLPKAFDFMDSSRTIDGSQGLNTLLLASFIIGLVFFWGLNLLIHMLTSKSIVHCAHDVESSGHDHSHGHSHHGSHHGGHHDTSRSGRSNGHDPHDMAHEHHEHNHHHHSHTNQRVIASLDAQGLAKPVDERSPLLKDRKHSVHQHYTLPDNVAIDRETPSSMLDATCGRICKCSGGSCKGFSSMQICARRIHDEQCTCEGARARTRDGSGDDTGFDEPVSETASRIFFNDDRESACPSEEQDPELHHHHVFTRFGHMFSIGLQTALAISLHKIPEGFLMFATNTADPDLGLQVFVALAIHNFCEGFTIACPLYLALENRVLATFLAILLGAGAQPLGGLVAQMVFKDHGLTTDMYLTFGIIVAATAGFMAIISLQMLCTAMTYGGKQGTVIFWTVVGMLIVLGVRCLH